MDRRKRNKKQASVLDDIRSSLSSISVQKYLQMWRDLPKFHQKALMVITPLLIVLIVIPFPQNDEESIAVTESERKEISVDTTDLSSVDNEEKKFVAKSEDWQEYQVKSGDTLAKVFRTNQLSMTDFNELVKVEGLDKPLSKIKQGQLIRYKLTANGDLDILQLEKKNDAVMFFRLSGGGFGRSK